LSKQTNNIVANKICVVSKIGLGTGIFGKMAVKGLTKQSYNNHDKHHKPKQLNQTNPGLSPLTISHQEMVRIYSKQKPTALQNVSRHANHPR